MVGHLFELVRILETVRATVGRIETLEVEMAASLTRGLAIALDLAALALVTADVGGHGQHLHGKRGIKREGSRLQIPGGPEVLLG